MPNRAVSTWNGLKSTVIGVVLPAHTRSARVDLTGADEPADAVGCAGAPHPARAVVSTRAPAAMALSAFMMRLQDVRGDLRRLCRVTDTLTEKKLIGKSLADYDSVAISRSSVVRPIAPIAGFVSR